MLINPFARAATSAKRRQLKEANHDYDRNTQVKDIEEKQLAALRETWSFCINYSNFYRWWREKHDLPITIDSLQSLQEFPILRKVDLLQHQDLVFNNSSSGRVYSTGGSTGEPTRFPAAKYENRERYLGNFIGRSWWDIDPTDSSVLVWGHSHLYGTGAIGKFNHGKRVLFDHLVNRRRLDGYDASRSVAQRNLNEVLRLSPSYLIGYTSALYRMAVEVDHVSMRALSSMNLKGAILTAETADSHEVETIRDAFGCPVLIEYGAAETGVIAFSKEDTWNIRVLWKNHVVSLGLDNSITISTLGTRRFPLINYGIEDLANVKQFGTERNVLAFSSLSGRKSEVVTFQGTGSTTVDIVAIQPVHILKAHPSVRSIQFFQNSARELDIYVDLLDSSLLNDVGDFFVREMRHHYPEIAADQVRFVANTTPQRSTSGKHLLFRTTR